MLETTSILNNEFTGVAYSLGQTPTTLYHAKKFAIMDKFKTCSDKVDIKGLAFLYGLMGWETVSSIFGFSKILFGNV